MSAEFKPPDEMSVQWIDTPIEGWERHQFESVPLEGYAEPRRSRPWPLYALMLLLLPALVIEVGGWFPPMSALTAWTAIMFLYYVAAAGYRIAKLR